MTYCPIPNPFEVSIDEKMHQIRHMWRWSYPVIIALLMLLIIAFFVIAMSYLAVSAQALGT